MIAVAKVYIHCGDNEMFAAGTAEKMIGQVNDKGQKIKFARQLSPTSIELEVEIEIPDDLFADVTDHLSVQKEGEE